jgi:outer membrane protein, heavy metal efflux system
MTRKKQNNSLLTMKSSYIGRDIIIAHVIRFAVPSSIHIRFMHWVMDGIIMPMIRPVRFLQILPCVSLVMLTACAGFQTYEPAPVDVEQTFMAIQAHHLDDPELADYFQDAGYVYETWPLSDWDLTALTLAALYFNPELKIARVEWARNEAAETTAAQQPNPMLNLPLEWHSDTSEDKSPWTLGLILDLVFERHAKRQARIDQAAMLSMGARIETEHTAWRIRNAVMSALLNYHSARELYDQLDMRLDTAVEILRVIEQRERAGEIGSFELAAARLDLQRNRLAVIEQARLKEAALIELAAALSVTPDTLRDVELVVPDFSDLPAEGDLPSVEVRGLALLQRYDIRKALADYSVAEAGLRLEIEKQYPDINLSPGFIFDQHDKIWTMGAAWLLPLFHRNEGEIAEALAARELQRQELSGLQARIMQDVYKARNEYLGLHESYSEAVDLRHAAGEYSRKVNAQYDAGYADRLQQLRASLELNETGRMVLELRGAMLRAFAVLEDSMQFSVLWPVMLPEPEPLVHMTAESER